MVMCSLALQVPGADIESTQRKQMQKISQCGSLRSISQSVIGEIGRRAMYISFHDDLASTTQPSNVAEDIARSDSEAVCLVLPTSNPRISHE